MCHMSVQDVDKRMVNVPYYYYVTRRVLAGHRCSCPYDLFCVCMEVMPMVLRRSGDHALPAGPDEPPAVCAEDLHCCATA